MHLEATRVISRPCKICSGEVALVSRGCESAFRDRESVVEDVKVVS
jgi:hypothetical protein